MSANFLNTNRNASRYFFATSENGEQTLGLQFGTTGGSPNLSTMAVTISGGGGNGVIVNQAPSYQATDYIFAEEGMGVYGSTYFTPSTLATTITGINLTTDRNPGSGLACIESYSGNGAFKGFEFLARGVDSALQSTVMDSYLSTIGAPGATAKLGANGQFVAGQGLVAPVAVSLSAQDTTGAGTACFSIDDLSGGNPLGRWSIYKYGPESGGNTGTDLALGAYSDAGNFITAPIQIRRSDGATALNNLSSINGVAFDLSGVLPWEVYTVLNTATQAVALSPGVPQTVLTFTNIPVPAQGVNAGGMMMSVPIAIQNTSLAGPASINLVGYFGGSASGGSGVHANCVLTPGLNSQTITLSGVAIHNGSFSTLTITAVSDTAGTFNFTQGSSAFYKFFFQPVF